MSNNPRPNETRPDPSHKTDAPAKPSETQPGKPDGGMKDGSDPKAKPSAQGNDKR